MILDCGSQVSLIDMGLRMNSFSVLGLRMRFISVSKHTGRSLVHAVFKLVLRMSFISVFVLEYVLVVLEIENHYNLKLIQTWIYLSFRGIYDSHNSCKTFVETLCRSQRKKYGIQFNTQIQNYLILAC